MTSTTESSELRNLTEAMADLESQLRLVPAAMQPRLLLGLKLLVGAFAHPSSQAALLVVDGATEHVSLVEINATPDDVDEMLDFIKILNRDSEESRVKLQ